MVKENGILIEVTDEDIELIESNPTEFWSNVNEISDSAFPCSNIKKLIIPEGIIKIGNHAFESMENLEEVVIPGSVKKVGHRIFQGCCNLKKIIINEGVTEIGSEQFLKCESLEEISLPSSLTKIKHHAFDECQSLKKLILPESVREIEYNAFNKCSSLEEITIPNCVNELDSHIFNGCTNLKKVTLPENLTYIPKLMFAYCKSLTEIIIPEGVTEIGDSAFRGCSGLKKIVMPINLQKGEWGVFDDCNIEEVVFPEGTKEISLKGFKKKYIKKVIIPQSVTKIGKETFLGCSSLAEITIPEGVTEIGDTAFKGSSSLVEITIPEGVTEIGSGAFENCTGLKRITTPESITQIGNSAFRGCSSLAEITIPEGVTEIGNSAFRVCSSLKKITIPESVIKFGTWAFADCSSLVEITMPEGVTEIGSGAFENCTSLKRIILPNTIKLIDEYVFQDCTNLEEINIPETVTEIGDMAFAGCLNLQEITIPESVTEIGEDAFLECKNLKRIEISPNLINFNIDQLSHIDKVVINAGSRKIVTDKLDRMFFTYEELVLNKIYSLKPLKTLLKKINPEILNTPDANVVEFAKFTKMLGLFETKETIKVNGKDIKVSDFAYTIIQNVFVKNNALNYNEMHMQLSGLGNVEFNSALLKFMINKTNCQDIINNIKNLPLIYNWFENRTKLEITGSEQSNGDVPTIEENRFKVYHYAEREDGSYKERWSAPTYELIMEELSSKPYNNTNTHTMPIANELQKHTEYKDQKFFDKAVEINEEREQLLEEGKITNHILSEPLKQDVVDAVEEYKKRTEEMSSQILDNCAEVLGRDTDSSKYIFTYEMLSKSSPENFSMGCFTSCCAKLFGAGAGAQRAMIIHPDLQPLVIRNIKGEIIAFSILYVNRQEGYVVCNDVEVNRNYDNDIQREEIYNKFKKGIEAFVKKYNAENEISIKQVNCGISPNWNAINDFIRKNPKGEILKAVNFNEFKYAGTGYWAGDWQKEQYVIWKQDGVENER